MSNSMETWVIVVSVIVLAVVLSFVFPQQNESRVCFSEKCFDVELASSQQERSTGLMYRTELKEDKGMLFVFPVEGNYGFWMKNTLIPLDIIWISNGKIVYIAENMEPCEEICEVIEPNTQARYVLEINGGLSEKLGLKFGDDVSVS